MSSKGVDDIDGALVALGGGFMKLSTGVWIGVGTILGGAVAMAAAPIVLPALGAAGLLGAAGTGTAISTLSGAALTSASTAALTGTMAGSTAALGAGGAVAGGVAAGLTRGRAKDAR